MRHRYGFCEIAGNCDEGDVRRSIVLQLYRFLWYLLSQFGSVVVRWRSSMRSHQYSHCLVQLPPD